MKESYLVTGVQMYAGIDIEDGKIVKAPKTLQNFIGQTLDILKVALIRSRLKVNIEKVEDLSCE